MKTQKTLTNVEEPNLGDKPGLKHTPANSTGAQEIHCHECRSKVEFLPREIYWRVADDDFEVADVKCPVCSETFELTAAFLNLHSGYDYFTERCGN